MLNLDHVLAAAPIVAAGIARKLGIAVRWMGSRAYTQPGLIVLPATPLPTSSRDEPAVRRFLDLTWGYLVHEAFHQLLTTFPLPSTETPLHDTLFRAVEDLRIEARGSERFPGARRYLAALTQRLVDEGLFGMPTEEEPPSVQLYAYVLLFGRANLLGQTAFAAAAAEMRRRLEALFGTPFVVRTNGLIGSVPHAATTEDAALIAWQLIGLLEEEAERTAPPAPPSADDGSCDGAADGDIDGDAAAAPSPPDATPDAGAASDPDPTDDVANDTPPGPGDAADADGPNVDAATDDTGASATTQQPDGETADDAANATRHAACRAALDASADEQPEDFSARVARAISAAHDAADAADCEMIELEAGGELDAPGTEAWEVEPATIDLGRVQQSTARLRSALRNRLVTFTQRNTKPSARGRRLLTARLPRLLTGDTKLFGRREEAREIDTAVAVLLDKSGSMASDNKIELARDALVASALALESVPGVRLGIAAFPRFAWALKFGQRLGNDVGRLGLLPTGFTPLAEALWLLAPELLAQPAARRVVIVLTDGDPDSPGAALTAIRRLTNLGIELVGVGIKHLAVEQLFARRAVIQHVADLPAELLRILEDTLKRSAQRVA